ELLHRVAEVADRVVHRLPAGVAELALQRGGAVLAEGGRVSCAGVGCLAAHAGWFPGDGCGRKEYGRARHGASAGAVGRVFAGLAPGVHPVRSWLRELAWTGAISLEAWRWRGCCRWWARDGHGPRSLDACCRWRCARATPLPW